jgi:transposase, IS30 family
MPKGYQHLTHDLRCQIYALKRSGLSQNKIAEQLGVDQSTISKELRRNAGRRGYRYKQAHEKAMQRRHDASSVASKMTPDFIPFVELLIRKNKMSPEQISGRLRKSHGISISHESIYRHVWRDKKEGGDLYENLRQRGKKRNKRGSKNAGRGLIPNRVGIEFRPAEVATKQRVGDWEGDTIVGKDHRGAIVSMVERKTKLVRLKLIPAATAQETTKATISILDPFKKYVLTITTDNGKEFSGHKNIADALDAQIYFANPYHSWERGLNENTNGLVRQFFPKKTDFTKLTHEQVKEVEDNLNNRPRKMLKFRTPNEEFLHLAGIVPGYALRC